MLNIKNKSKLIYNIQDFNPRGLEKESEARLIIEESKCGYCDNHKNYDEIIKVIQNYYDNTK